MYLVDTTSTNYSDLSGANQTWDYSMLGGYMDNTRIVSVTNSDMYDAIFPDATYVSSIPVFMNTAYEYAGFAGDKMSHGYEFELPNFGVVQFILNDFQKMLQFPFALGDSFEDEFNGSIVIMDEPSDAEGTTWVTADATGTLILANDVSHTDVLRVHALDTIYSEISAAGLPFPVAVTIVRQQFDYIKPGASNFPLFTHATLKVLNPFIGEIKIGVVLSTENPTVFVNTAEYALAEAQVYPNPTENFIQLQLPMENETAQVVVTDLAGRVLYQNDAYTNNENIDLKNEPAGFYLVNILQNGVNSTAKIIKK
jgi:hypothetical protein